MMTRALLKELLVPTVFMMIASLCKAQPSFTNPVSSTDLYRTIAAMDSTFFDAFNKCNVEKSQSLFTEDLEFFHDVGGLTNFNQNASSIKARCQGKRKIRRELVEGSLKVYPIKDYGAIQIGKHRFYYTEEGKAEMLDGTFKFVHVWQLKNGNWKISRIISYDH